MTHAIDMDVQKELIDTITDFIEDNKGRFLPGRKEQLADYCVASLSYFTDDGFTRQDIKNTALEQITKFLA